MLFIYINFNSNSVSKDEKPIIEDSKSLKDEKIRNYVFPP